MRRGHCGRASFRYQTRVTKMYEPVNLKLDAVDCGLIEWWMFHHALERLAGPIDDDVMDRVTALYCEPGGCYEIGQLLEVDPALVLLAYGLSEGLTYGLGQMIGL